MSKFAPIIGFLGLVVDLAFHWAATADPSNVPAVMTTLLVDTDLVLVGSVWGRRGERTRTAAEHHPGTDFTAATRTVRIGRGRLARADALEEAR